MTPAQFDLLLTVKAHGVEPPTQGAILAQMPTTHATLVGPLTEMVARRFLDRRRDGGDHRRVVVSLTSAGEGWLEPCGRPWASLHRVGPCCERGAPR